MNHSKKLIIVKNDIILISIIALNRRIAQMTGSAAFGEYTDEIIEYVASKTNNNESPIRS